MKNPRSNTPSGQWLSTIGGVRAFHPNPLPPVLDMTPMLMRVLSSADRLIGQLAAEGAKLPNPHLLLRPFIRREAVYSSRIEGTQATLGELLAAEAGAVVERSPDDLREVGNYVAAMEAGLESLQKFPLSLRLMRQLHRKLMAGVCGHHAQPGEFRRTQNWIGPAGSTLPNATYVPPPPDSLLEHLGLWETFLHDESLPPLIQAGLIHYQFEAIHPFLDGNGRIGRLLIMLFLCQRQVLPSPLLYLSAFFDATRSEYYQCLRGVSERSDWEGWLHYFLNGVARQSEDALSRCRRMNEIVLRWHMQTAKEQTKVPSEIVDLLAGNPYLTTRGIQSRLGIGYNTASRAIERLMTAKILVQVGDAKRDRVFCAKSLLDILEEPPKISP